jgi:hypothetical protein
MTEYMTPQRKMLLESLSGHLALLGQARPKKAASSIARKTRRYVRSQLSGFQIATKRLSA